MEIKLFFLNKKGFAFSFLVFFIAIVMFAFLNLAMFKTDFSKDNIFIDSRVNYVSNELTYFKSVYLENIISYSFYNTINALAEYSSLDPNNFKELNGNYSKLNELIFEGMINGSFDGNIQTSLTNPKNKTITYFLDKYKLSFNDNYKANLTLNVIDINVYEVKPYYLTIQVLISLNVITNDNVSNWNSTESVFVTVPISDLPIPDFLYYEDTYVSSKSVEYNLPTQNWTLNNFQQTINESYSSIFVEKEHKYSIGNSYLKRLLNISQSSYHGVIGFWSFDYDLSEGNIYDTSLYNNFSIKLGNSIGLYNFNNDSINGLNLNDISNYDNDGILNGLINCSREGVYDKACFFDGNNDFIKVGNFNNIEKEISVFAWVNVNNTTVENKQRIVCADNEYFCYFVYNNGDVGVRLDTTNIIGSGDEIIFPVNLSFNNWHHIGFTYDGNLTLLYLDGIRYLFQDGVDNSFKFSGDLNGNIGDLFIGNSFALNHPFFGLIDEVGIYSKVLSKEDIAKLYNQRQVYDTDYLTSFHGSGVYFDGKDDFINLGNNSIYNFNNNLISLEFWFKVNNISQRQTLIDKGDRLVEGWGVELFNGRVEMGNHNFGTAFTDKNPINKTNYWYHVVINGFDTNKPEIYVNNKLYTVSSSGGWPGSSLTNYNLTIGKSSSENDYFFNGVIDEIKIYNRSLTKNEISNNYFSYDSFGKGCCNYIILMNPNKYGYTNSLSDKVNISYTTKLFYDYHIRGIYSNISLYNLTNVTSNDINKNYYNFLFDDCVAHAFSVSDYQNENNSIKLNLYKLNGIDGNNCSNLIKNGIY